MGSKTTHKFNRLTICQGLLNCCRNQGDSSLRCIVTADEVDNPPLRSIKQTADYEMETFDIASQKKFKSQPWA
jgi:hypothetical protein